MDVFDPVAGQVFPQGKRLAGIVAGMVHGVFVAVHAGTLPLRYRQLHRIDIRQHQRRRRQSHRLFRAHKAEQVKDPQFGERQRQLAAAPGAEVADRLRLAFPADGKAGRGACLLAGQQIAAANHRLHPQAAEYAAVAYRDCHRQFLTFAAGDTG